MTLSLQRNPTAAASADHDLIVVGGGVYGVTLVLEAARRGYRPLLLERRDFNAGTSFNALRIVHGGLRYLQSMDIRRFYESVGERRWFFRNFPDLVAPLSCLMPLYNRGLKRRSTFGMALRLNDLLGLRRNDGVDPSRHLRRGKIINNAQVESMFPQVDRAGLHGGGCWYDGVMAHHQRVIIEMLRWAVSCGGTVLNYTEATGIASHGGAVQGVDATDTVAGATHSFTAPVVINAAGPRSAALAESLGQPAPQLFTPSMAFNLLIDHPPLSASAVAVEPKEPGARTYFVQPWRGRMLAGTFHAPWPADGPLDDPQPSEAQIDEFLRDLNTAVPGLALQREQVLRVYCGLLPAEKPGHEETAHRPVWVEHGRSGGPTGLFSVSGVKYTTARLVAEQTLRRVYGSKLRDYAADTDRPPAAHGLDFYDYRPNAGNADAIRAFAELESVVYLDDMIHRRTDWGADPRDAEHARAELEGVLELSGDLVVSP